MDTLAAVIEFPSVVPGDQIDVSATSFVTFLRCPEYAAARFRGEYGPESRAGFSGKLAHRLFARHLNGQPTSPTHLEQVCREEIGSGMNVNIGALKLKPSELGRVIEEVGGLYDRFKVLQLEGFVGAEVALEVTPRQAVLLKGSIDAVFEDDGGVRLIDWKTGRLDDPLDQLHFYALLWALTKDELPARVEAVSVRTGERQEDVPSRASVDATAVKVAEMVNQMRTSWASGAAPDRHGGPWCRYCPVLDGCSEGQAATAVISA